MAEHPYLTATEDGVFVDVHVQPGAHKARVVGRHGDALKVAVAAPPIEGRANDALVKALADVFGVPASDVSIVSGESSRQKRINVVGIDERGAQIALDNALASGSRPGRR